MKIDFKSNPTQAIDITFSSNSKFTANFGSYVGGGTGHIYYATTDYYNQHIDMDSKRGYIYIYSDWRKDPQNNDIAGIKVGDGVNKVVDLPFTDEMLFDHIYDMVRHITQEEREFWNNKVTAFESGNEEVTFTKENIIIGG